MLNVKFVPLRTCSLFQNKGSSRRRAEPVSVEDQDKPYVCDSKGAERLALNRHARPVQILFWRRISSLGLSSCALLPS